MLQNNMIYKKAIELIRLGIPVLPCNQSKAPITDHGVKDASTDKEQIENWFKEYPSAMLGIALGSVSGLIVIDCDRHIEGVNGVSNFINLCEEHKYLPKTKIESTPSKGLHFYYSVDKNNCPNSKIGFLDGVDLLSNGKYVITEPSESIKGQYKLIKKYDIIQPLPDWLFEYFTKDNQKEKIVNPIQQLSDVSKQKYTGNTPYAEAVLDNAYKKISSAVKGTRQITFFNKSCIVFSFVAGKELSESLAYERLFRASYNCGLLQEDKQKVINTLDDAKRKGFSHPFTSPTKK